MALRVKVRSRGKQRQGVSRSVPEPDARSARGAKTGLWTERRDEIKSKRKASETCIL